MTQSFFCKFQISIILAIMFVNVRSITKQIGNIVVQAYNRILPKIQIVSSDHEASKSLLSLSARPTWILINAWYYEKIAYSVVHKHYVIIVN